ncbi:hypothetical protein DUNSADRAFT_16086 [Dunaliella salina]|uniref:RAP domain-containing protein n=1 Tax=Dunaliella salina TaxID=3046 RepID=A0ABQ7G492_DUNSA|nr:hypothetical protein DUNSADRAFT_16086 [Dunaliella salina]|eukprot:KAF5829426.1 hypothetical protein DUNSADRAFT_16086 [Dunaliella salina]
MRYALIKKRDFAVQPFVLTVCTYSRSLLHEIIFSKVPKYCMMLLHSPPAHHSISMSTGASACYPSPLLRRSPLLRHHTSRLSRLSRPSRTQGIHLLPSTSLVPCQAKRSSSSSFSGGGKKGGSSGSGFSLDNVDKLLAERPELRVGDRNNKAAEDRRRSSAPFKTGMSRKPTLMESLDTVEMAASPSPAATADMLYHLGDALKREAMYRQLGSMEQTRVAAAMAKLSDLLLEEQGSSKRVEQLGGKHLSLSAWGMGKVGSKGIQVSTRLGDAFAECALACPSMDGPGAKGKGWLNWANLLYSLAEAGVVCSKSKHVQAAFDTAVNNRLLVEGQKCNGQDVSNTLHATASAGYAGNLEPLVSAVAGDLTSVMKSASAQDWSNTIWALAKHEEMKAGRLGPGLPIILHDGLAVTSDLALRGAVVPQNLSNILWALAKLGWKGDMSVVGILASALTMRAANSNPQDASNTLWALAELGWYDASTYSTLISTLVQKVRLAQPQALSVAFLACAEAQHWESNVEELALLISKQSVQQWGQWNFQTIANTLYSWAVLTAVGAAPASPSFARMAQQLFSCAACREASTVNFLDLCQLYLAHQVALFVALPGGGLSADQVLLKACAKSYEAQQQKLQKQIRCSASLEQELAAVMQHAGYDVKRDIVIGREFVQLQVQGAAVRVAVAENYFRTPQGLLKGSVVLHDVLAGWVCKGSVIISEAEWADLQGDPQRQQAFLAQHLQQMRSKV